VQITKGTAIERASVSYRRRTWNMQDNQFSAEDAIRLLKEGNARFVAGCPEYPRQDRSRRNETAMHGQKPFITVLACSDSRQPVEKLFDVGIGDVFVVRVAGNIAGPTQIASIEYAIEHLGTPLFMVLSHSKCGAVSAVFEHGALSGNLQLLSDKIYPAIVEAKKKVGDVAEELIISEAIKHNMWNAIEDAFNYSKTIREKVKNSTLKVIGAFYDIASGTVHWMGSHPNEKQLAEKGIP
jgi:carbonic anhydrase